VVVEELPAILANFAATKDITQERLRKSVEARLAAARIAVLNPGEFPVGDPFLRVRITATAPQKGLVGYRVEIDFAQIVFMRRNPAVTFNRAQTWSATPVMGLGPSSQLAENINKALARQVEQFIAAYFAANPR